MSVDDLTINLNQNLWGLLISIVTLGTGEYFCLQTLYWVGVTFTSLTGLSYIITLISYTRNYLRNKNKK